MTTYCFSSPRMDASTWDCTYTRIWRIQGGYFGVSPLGVVKLKGTPDGSVPIKVEVVIRSSTQNSGELKRVPYARVAALGNIDVDLIMDGTSSGGRVDLADHNKRVKFGRGARGRVADIRISSTDPKFLLAGIEPKTETLTRGYS